MRGFDSSLFVLRRVLAVGLALGYSMARGDNFANELVATLFCMGAT